MVRKLRVMINADQSQPRVNTHISRMVGVNIHKKIINGLDFTKIYLIIQPDTQILTLKFVPAQSSGSFSMDVVRLTAGIEQ